MAFSFPILSIKEAKKHISNLRSLHPKAVHVCFAWRVGIGKFEDRYSDDGEPNNSAGKPIFGQILAAEVTNVLIAVVRYYGGTNLGVGGLVSAYKAAAKDAMQKAEIVEKLEAVRYRINFDPQNTKNLMSLLRQMKVDIITHGFEGVLHSVEVEIPKSAHEEIFNTFENSKEYTIELLE